MSVLRRRAAPFADEGGETLTIALLLALVAAIYLAAVGLFGIDIVALIDGVTRRLPT